MIDVEENSEQDEPQFRRLIIDRVMQKMVQVLGEKWANGRPFSCMFAAPLASTYTLEYLTKYADVTIYFANSNIHPKAEYHKRAYVTKKFCQWFQWANWQ